MTIRRKDFQKAVNFIQDFQLKLCEAQESAELRDSLNLCLLYLRKYYQKLKSRTQDQLQDSLSLSQSLSRGLSPLAPFRDAPDRFQWRWINLENASVLSVSKHLPGNETLSDTITPLLRAAKLGDFTMIQRVLDQDGIESLNDVDALGRNCVMYATHYNQLNILDFFLQKDIDPNFTALDGSSAVHRACHDDNVDALKILMKYGADITLQDQLGRAPLHWAISIQASPCLPVLLQSTPSEYLLPVDVDGLSPLMWACRMDCLDNFIQLRQLANRDEQSLELDRQGRAWIHWAVRRTKPLHCLKYLLNSETALLADYEGKSVVHIAAEQGSLDACKLMVEILGTDCIHYVDKKARTPLHLAAMCGHGELVNFFCENEAKMDCIDSQNLTPVSYVTARRLHYCSLIFEFYKQQAEGVPTAERPSISPHPPSLPPTPRSARSKLTSRSSNKRSSTAASINGSSIEDTFRSKQSEFPVEGPIYYQNKRDRKDVFHTIPTSNSPEHIDRMVIEPNFNGSEVDHRHYNSSIDNRFEEVIHPKSEDRESEVESDAAVVDGSSRHSDIDDPPTVIHRSMHTPPPPRGHPIANQHFSSNSPPRQPQQLYPVHHSGRLTRQDYPSRSAVHHSAPRAYKTKSHMFGYDPSRDSTMKPVQMEDAAALKEHQLSSADIPFMPLHRRPSPSAQLEPLKGLNIRSNTHRRENDMNRNKRKRIKRDSHSLPSTKHRLEPLVEPLQGSSLSIQSAHLSSSVPRRRASPMRPPSRHSSDVPPADSPLRKHQVEPGLQNRSLPEPISNNLSSDPRGGFYSSVYHNRTSKQNKVSSPLRESGKAGSSRRRGQQEQLNLHLPNWPQTVDGVSSPLQPDRSSHPRHL